MATTRRRMVIHRAGQSGSPSVDREYQNYVSTGDAETKFKEAKTNERSVVDGMSHLRVLVPRAYLLGRTCTVRPPGVSVSCARFSFPCTNE